MFDTAVSDLLACIVFETLTHLLKLDRVNAIKTKCFRFLQYGLQAGP